MIWKSKKNTTHLRSIWTYQVVDQAGLLKRIGFVCG